VPVCGKAEQAMSIRITPKIREAMWQQAKLAYPFECCGLIVGKAGKTRAEGHYYVPCDNSRDLNRERRFLIDPLLYQNVEDRAEREGLDIVSVVHSHPDHPDQPSEFDRTHAWPGFSYIIIAVEKGEVVSYRSWQLMENRERFTEEPILL